MGPRIGSSFQSSPGGLDDQLLSLGSLTQIAAQVTPNPGVLWFGILQQQDCLLKPIGVSYHCAHLSFRAEEADHCGPTWSCTGGAGVSTDAEM